MAAMRPEFQMFPPAHQLIAEWAPVYIEPMQGSGERFVALVVATDSNGAAHVELTLRPKVLRCMYGDQAEVLLSVVELIQETLQDHLALGGSIHDWQPPISTCALGPVRHATGPDLAGVAARGASLTASLSGEASDESKQNTNSVAPDVDRWLQQIRASVRQRTELLDSRFNSEITIKTGASPTRIGYLGDRIAANFDALVPGPNLSARRIRSKARLLDLQILRDQVDLVFKRSSYELMLWVPEKNSPGYTQRYLDSAYAALSELKEFGDKHELRVRPLHNADDAAEHILSFDKAA